MDLWTEFEGVTIDSAYPLNKLLETEGRSAFFSTFNARGEPVLIRIIECHFDEDEILARWRGVQTLGHPNFLRIDRFGQFLIEADDITAVYAVFERVDANLGEVLEKGCLSAADAAQIGLSIASALDTLHTHGFVHEHVEPRNIYAVGETVKLRSDCVRETPEGEAGIDARRRDARDLALVLMHVLLGMPRTSSGPQQSIVPAPFDEIVRNGMSGEWGLAEMQSALTSLKSLNGSPRKASAPRPLPPAAAAATPRSFDAAPLPPLQTATRSGSRSEPAASADTRRQSHNPFPGTESKPFELSTLLSDLPRDLRRWIGAGALLAVVLLIGWMFLRRINHHAVAVATPAPAAHVTKSPPAPAPAVSSRSGSEWRVVAFTYNQKDQAQKKASSLALKHPGLHPEVFSPSGRSPWLVTVGGALSRDDAYALARKAGSLGLPRDTYAQNYAAR
jgi:hypothetical protein